MQRDRSLYPDPEVFKPERFLDEFGGLKPTLPETHGQGHVTFGFGKRYVILSLVLPCLFYTCLSAKQVMPWYAPGQSDPVHRHRIPPLGI